MDSRYVVFQVGQQYVSVICRFQELPANSVLLVYLSATGVFPTGHSDYEGKILGIGPHVSIISYGVFINRAKHSPQSKDFWFNLMNWMNSKPMSMSGGCTCEYNMTMWCRSVWSISQTHVILALSQLSSHVWTCPVGPYDFGGVLTNTNRDVVNGETVQKRNQAQKEMHWWEVISHSH